MGANQKQMDKNLVLLCEIHRACGYRSDFLLWDCGLNLNSRTQNKTLNLGFESKISPFFKGLLCGLNFAKFKAYQIHAC